MVKKQTLDHKNAIRETLISYASLKKNLSKFTIKKINRPYA